MANKVDTDKEFKKFIRNLKGVAKLGARVGWVENSPKEQRTDGGHSNAEIASFVINGNLRTGQPPRDFLKNVENTKMAGYLKKLGDNIATHIASYNPSNPNTIKKEYRTILKKVGIQAAADIKIELTDNTEQYAGNAESTIKSWQAKRPSNRGATKQLFVDTSQLKNSITSVVK